MKKKPKILTDVHVEKIGYGWVGIARQSDGRKIIVTGGVLPGMRADVLVTKNKKDYTEGKLYHVRAYDNAFTPEPAGVKCPHYTFHAEDGLTHEGLGAHKVGCGGCKRQILNYDKQLLLKQQIVEDSFRHIKDTISQVGIRPFLPAPEVYGYRNKIEYSFGKYITATDTADEMRQERQLGFHKQGQFSKVIDIDACYLVTDTAKKLFTHLKKFFAASGLPVYDQKTHSGFLRHLVVREGVNTGHFLVNLSVSEAQLPALHLEQTWEDVKAALLADEFLKELVTTFVITVNDGLADVVKGESMHTYLLRWEGFIYEKLLFAAPKKNEDEEASIVDASFRVSPFSFFQTNTLGAQRLFQAAVDAVGEVRGTVLDLYCGTWSIGISFLKQWKWDSVVGIEIVPEAIVDAARNAKINGVSEQCYFVAGKAEDLVFRDEYLAQQLEKISLVIIDPPRDGLHKQVVEFLLKLKKDHDFTLLYISCNPVTMARDLQLLTWDSGYKLRSLQPVDMFPHTHHVEMIGVLS